MTIDVALRYLGFGARDRRARRRRRPGTHACRRACACTLARRVRAPTIVCAQAGNVNSGAFDPIEDDLRRPRTSTARGCTSTARSACGPRSPTDRRDLVARRRARRLVGDRRAQVAERAVRLRRRDLSRRRRASGHDDDAGELPRAGWRRCALRPVRLGTRVLAPRPRRPRVRRDSRARARGHRGSASRATAPWRRRFAVRLAREPGVDDPQRRRAQPGARPLRRLPTNARARSSTACSATARAGSAAPCGTVSRRCASRCRTGPRPKPTSTPPSTRSCGSSKEFDRACLLRTRSSRHRCPLGRRPASIDAHRRRRPEPARFRRSRARPASERRRRSTSTG